MEEEQPHNARHYPVEWEWVWEGEGLRGEVQAANPAKLYTTSISTIPTRDDKHPKMTSVLQRAARPNHFFMITDSKTFAKQFFCKK